MAESVIVTGQGLTVEQTGPEPTVNPKRKRPAEYVAPPAPDVDLLQFYERMAIDNPYWSAEANDWADAHPEVRPKDAARKWIRHHIINPAKEPE